MKKLLFFSLLLFCFSCVKEEAPNINDSNSDLEVYGESIQLTEAQIQAIADGHNNTIIKNLDVLNWESEDLMKEMELVYMKGIDLPEHFPDILSNTELNELDLFKSNPEFLNNPDLFLKKVSELEQIVLGNYDSHKVIESRLNKFYANLDEELTGDDLLLLKVGTKVGISSSKLWMSSDQGGLGYGDKFIAKLKSEKSAYDCTQQIINADINAATNYVLISAMRCAIAPPLCASLGTPIGGGVWLAGMAAAAALASGQEALRCYGGY